MNKIILKPGKEKSLYRLHPWVFSGAIARVDDNTRDGDLVEIYNHDREFLAIGHYQAGTIAIRVLTFRQEPVDRAFWTTRLRQALRLRHAAGLVDNPATNTYRLVHGEGDSLPGLVIDYYAGTAVIQFHSIGMYLARQEITDALRDVMGDRLLAVYDKSSGTLPRRHDLTPRDGYLWGNAPADTVLENGLTFRVDWVEGQKTGFFIDQRDNRSLLQHYASGKDILNICCYTGGFSVYALRGGARLVHSVDASARAIDLTEQNIRLNFPDDSRHQAIVDDAFHFLASARGRYDLVILDPPAFAKHLGALDNAIQGYKRLNRAGIEALRPGGILFTFSCSQVIARDTFRQTLFTAAANTGREAKILHQLTQPADHPISIFHPEGEYLKGLVLQLD